MFQCVKKKSLAFLRAYETYLNKMPLILLPSERGRSSRKKRPRANSDQKNEANLETGHDKQEEERNKQKLSTDIKDKEDLSGIEEPPVDRNHWISDRMVRICMICNLQIFTTVSRIF